MKPRVTELSRQLSEGTQTGIQYVSHPGPNPRSQTPEPEQYRAKLLICAMPNAGPRAVASWPTWLYMLYRCRFKNQARLFQVTTKSKHHRTNQKQARRYDRLSDERRTYNEHTADSAVAGRQIECGSRVECRDGLCSGDETRCRIRGRRTIERMRGHGVTRKQNAEEEQPAPSKKVYYIRMRIEPYRATQTEKALHGNVACELSPQLYGASVWWVLLDDLEKVYSGQPKTV